MSPQDLSVRQLFKFTGPPENWLTAIKYMTWGLEEKYLSRWQEIEPGDIFLMHSTSTNTIVKGAPSSIIGFGVVSPEFSRKNSPLWLQEIEQRKNIWPLLVPFSEIYLFSELRPDISLEAPTGSNNENIVREAKELLSNTSPLPEGFPQMGSFSSVRPEIVAKIFEQAGQFYLYRSAGVVSDSFTRPTKLKPLEKPTDVMRKPASLQELHVVKKKTIKVGSTTYTKDLQATERADNAHQETLGRLFELLKSQGYKTYFNNHVDVFALKGTESFLFEVKSLAKKNFRSQTRKGIVQLLEYEYFEIHKFLKENREEIRTQKALVFSRPPSDMNYVAFVNNLKMAAGHFSGPKLQTSGQALGLASLIR